MNLRGCRDWKLQKECEVFTNFYCYTCRSFNHLHKIPPTTLELVGYILLQNTPFKTYPHNSIYNIVIKENNMPREQKHSLRGMYVVLAMYRESCFIERYVDPMGMGTGMFTLTDQIARYYYIVRVKCTHSLSRKVTECEMIRFKVTSGSPGLPQYYVQCTMVLTS